MVGEVSGVDLRETGMQSFSLGFREFRRWSLGFCRKGRRRIFRICERWVLDCGIMEKKGGFKGCVWF